jgi:hypothetical protein
MNPHLPAPIVCGFFGALAGLLGGGCAQCFPVWVGAATGASLGCALCVGMCFFEPLPLAKIATRQGQDPVIIQHIHIYEMKSGAPKSYPQIKEANTESDEPSN